MSDIPLDPYVKVVYEWGALMQHLQALMDKNEPPSMATIGYMSRLLSHINELNESRTK